jgi:DNA (cytosine-5)-methyltransferase 1
MLLWELARTVRGCARRTNYHGLLTRHANPLAFAGSPIGEDRVVTQMAIRTTTTTLTAAAETAPIATPTTVPRLTAVDLFAGAGGASLGLVQAGFDLRLAAEMEPAFAATHDANLPGAVLQADLRGVAASKVLAATGVGPRELDVLFAGPPCQGFSMIGPRVVWDARNNLFLEVLRVAKALQPKAIVIENVPGLLTLGGGRYLAAILEGLAAHGYRAACAELLAAQYGAPQMRWRLVIVAWRDDLDIEAGFGFPTPTHGGLSIGDLVPNATTHPDAYAGFLTTRDAIADLPKLSAGELHTTYGTSRAGGEFQTYARSLPDGSTMPSATLHDHYAPAMSPQNIERIRALRPGQDWRDLPTELLPPSMQRALRKDHTRRYRRMTWGGVPRSIITRFRDPKSGEYIHPDQDRTISIREALRIQGFPDWFALEGTNTSKYTQVGNAVPVPLARAIATEVAACLGGAPVSPRLDDPFRRRPVPALGRHGQLISTTER